MGLFDLARDSGIIFALWCIIISHSLSLFVIHRKYENRNLGQMETVYPRAYIFRQEKNIPGIYDKKTYESYQLTVECNAREDGREEGEGEEGEKEKTNAVLDSSALLRRKKVFNMNLREITRRHHKVSERSQQNCLFVGRG